MEERKLIEKIISKKEFSELPKDDVEKVLQTFDKNYFSEEERIKLSRDLLRKMYTAFASQKLLNIKDKESEWFLKKHLSTRERLEFYDEIYKKLLNNFKGKINIFDLGAGVNGFSYDFFEKNVKYIGIEAVGQLVDLMNYFFNKNKLSGIAIHESLFNLEEIKKIILKEQGNKVIFLFKTLDSLEMLERNYSKKLLKEIVPLVDKVVVSFATRSLIKKTLFKAKRNWIICFIEDNFCILDDFELGNERYISFCKK